VLYGKLDRLDISKLKRPQRRKPEDFGFHAPPPPPPGGGPMPNGVPSPALIFPNGVTPSEYIFNAHNVVAGELYLVRDPLQVLQAAENGVSNVVSFLTPITAQSLEQLASLMDQRQVETALCPCPPDSGRSFMSASAN
jgi:hypothetical protein